MNVKRTRIYITLIFWVAFFFTQASSQNLSSILHYYQQGDFQSAAEELESYLISNPSDAEALYLAGKLERDAGNSVRYYHKIWQGTSLVKKEEAGLELCLYYRSAGLKDSLIQYCAEFKKSFPRSQLFPQVLWLESQAYLSSGKTVKALKGFENIIGIYPYSPWAAWAQLGLGEAYFSRGDFKKSLEGYKKVIDRYAESEVFPLALSGIYRLFDITGDKDKSVLYLNLYKEKYPQGIDTESEVISEEPGEVKEEGKAEKFTGTKYTIQIGVFSKKENADRMMGNLGSRGYSPVISYKTIDKKKYYLVQVGSFDSLQEAQKIREKLEREEGEVFTIVIK